MKKTLVFVMLLIIIQLPLSAQKTKEVIYLKNGSKIYGKLLEVTDSVYKIKTSDGSLFIYSLPEVEKYINESPLFEGRKKSGPGFVLEGGFLIGVKTSEYSNPFSFNIIGNMTRNTKNIFGLGSGVEYIGQPYVPLFVEYKYLFSQQATTPFFFVRGGKLFHKAGDSESTDYNYQSNNDKNYSGGSSFSVGTGISWSKENYETYLSFAYRNAHTSYTQKNYNSHIDTYKTTLNRLEVKLGFRF